MSNRRRQPRPYSWAGSAILIALLMTVLSACSEHEFHPPDAQERSEAAAEKYTIGMFDTLTWETQEERAFAGNIVYSTTCRRCHGTLGRGDTEYARNRGVDVPSLVEPGWALADSLEGIRYRTFVGHQEGMPVFSLSGLSVAEVDAVSAYILYQLRPEILGEAPPEGAEAGPESGI